ncbi:unnamed protein product [Closterium sp. Yama58-4]|nr:unnamed protein product [Closterium sp. Yama58-4]
MAENVTDDNFSYLVLSNKLPVVVLFHAKTWSGPCRMISPLIDQLAEEYSGRITCFKLGTSKNPQLAANYSIRSVPVVQIFKCGCADETIIGAVSYGALRATLEKVL